MIFNIVSSLMKKNDISKAVEILKNGGIVVFPTETVYGIGANALDENSIKKLYKAKNRPINKKTSILVGSVKMLEKYTKNISQIERKLIDNFFPGPLTLILHKDDAIPNIVTNNENIVGFRMPDNETALEIINELDIPLATSSANKSGEQSRY